ncbi:FlaD/FlaE family flagellar protein [uncultured Methanomethylovorans sp.]|uniref:FlaD/FlaE family flagellar protein n=1 Tax=uncultured Methanomethylovorans sp. TaxID=183759 RepID=UPI002AA7CE2D|nr:FlaD/FlaE family flagellar protein [uncultured Methanomethylovorans sp.]
MSKLPWEQPGQKKGQEPNTNTPAGAPPFAAGAPIPDLFQKAFSGEVIQETSISPLPQENNSSQPPSNMAPPLFSMEMPDLNSLQSNHKPLTNLNPSSVIGGKQESLPSFLSQGPQVTFPGPGAPSADVKDSSKSQNAKKKQLPLFEMAVSDDSVKDGNSVPSTTNAIISPFLSGLSTPSPMLNESEKPNLPLFPAPAENTISSPFIQNTQVLGDVTPPPQNITPASVQFLPFSSIQASTSPIPPAIVSGPGNPFEATSSGSVAPVFPGGPSFDAPGNSPFAGSTLFKDPFSAPGSSPVSGSSSLLSPSPSAEPFSASQDPFGNGQVSSATDPFASQTNPFDAGSVFPGPTPFPPSGAMPSFPASPLSVSGTGEQDKKTGISGKMAGMSGNLVAGISELANSLVSNLRNLTKGKSLMDKLERIKEGNNHEDADSLQLLGTLGYENTIKKAKVDKSISVSDKSPFAPNDSVDHLLQPPSPFSKGSTADIHANDSASNDFVKVTPIENPLFDFPEALKIENNLHTSPSTRTDVFEDVKGKINSTTNEPKFVGKQENLIPEMPSLPASMKQRPSSPLYKPDPVPKQKSVSSDDVDSSVLYMSKELEDVREKLELSTGNVSQVFSMFEELSGNVTSLGDSVKFLQSSSDDVLKATGMKFDGLDERVGQLESRLSGIEQQVSHVQSENKNIMSSLSSIEQHISELVESYTALVSKMQETSQETDDRLSGLSSKIGLMESLVPRFANMEKSGAETSVAVQDLTGNISTLATDVSNVSASQQEIRDEMTELSKYVEGELKKIGASGYKVAGQSIQLTRIMKNSTSIKLCMEWLEFLMELVGRNNLPDILSYYEELGWITEEVRMELMRYAEGIDFYMEKPDWKLTPDDHVKSIWFIENLAGIKVDKNKLSVIDRDIEKVRKSSEIYNI